MKTAVIIPALDEQDAIGNVIGDIPRDRVSEIIVVDNGSRDRTAAVARAAGARVLHEPKRGYGAACLRGIAAARDPDIFVFLDGDYSDYPEEIGKVLDPVAAGEADLVLGSRIAGPDGRCCPRTPISATISSPGASAFCSATGTLTWGRCAPFAPRPCASCTWLTAISAGPSRCR